VVTLWCFAWLEVHAFARRKIRQLFEVYFLADGSHGGAEEGFEVVGGVGVLGDSGFDCFLGDGAGIAEVDQGGEGVVACGAVVWASGGGGDGGGEVV